MVAMTAHAAPGRSGVLTALSAMALTCCAACASASHLSLSLGDPFVVVVRVVERFAFWGGVSCRRCFTPNPRRTPPGAPTILGARRAIPPLPPSARSHRMLWVRVGEREPLLPPAVPLRHRRPFASSAAKTSSRRSPRTPPHGTSQLRNAPAASRAGGRSKRLMEGSRRAAPPPPQSAIEPVGGGRLSGYWSVGTL